MAFWTTFVPVCLTNSITGESRQSVLRDLRDRKRNTALGYDGGLLASGWTDRTIGARFADGGQAGLVARRDNGTLY